MLRSSSTTRSPLCRRAADYFKVAGNRGQRSLTLQMWQGAWQRD
jgi:hypothetical protein